MRRENFYIYHNPFDKNCIRYIAGVGKCHSNGDGLLFLKFTDYRNIQSLEKLVRK